MSHPPSPSSTLRSLAPRAGSQLSDILDRAIELISALGAAPKPHMEQLLHVKEPRSPFGRNVDLGFELRDAVRGRGEIDGREELEFLRRVAERHEVKMAPDVTSLLPEAKGRANLAAWAG